MQLPALLHLRPALVLLALAPFLPAQDGAAGMRELNGRRNPVLFCFVADGKARPEYRALVEDDVLLDMGMSTTWLGEATGARAASGRELRQRLGLGQAQWALLGPGQELLASGVQPPTAEALAQALRRAGFEGPIQQLRTFLDTRPEHLEARGQLLRRLRSAAIIRSRRQGGSAAGAAPELAEADDQRIWGALAREVDASLASGDWLAMQPWSGDPLLDGETVEEARSPLMKGVYRRHLKTVEQALRETPGSTVVWSHWVYMAVVLGDVPVAEVVAGLEPFLDLGNRQVRNWIPRPWLTPVLKAATRKKDWDLVIRLLRAPWREQSRFWLELSLPPRVLEQAGNQAWTDVGRPLLEALLRQGALGEAQELVGELAGHGEAAGQVTQAAALARSLHKPDLAREWEQLPPGPVRARNDGPWFYINPLLVVEATDMPARNAFLGMLGPLQDHAIGLNLLNPQPAQPRGGRTGGPDDGSRMDAALRDFLGWNGRQDRWALIAPGRKLIDQGLGLPTPAALVETCEAAGYRSPLAAVQAFLQEHPGHPEAQARLAECLREQGHLRVMRDPAGRRLLQLGPPSATPIPDLDPGLDQTFFGDYAAALEGVLEFRLWREQNSQQPLNCWPWYPECRQSPSLKALAGKWLPELEEALLRAPANEALWLGWNHLHGLGREGSLKALLGRLELSPVESPQVWPPRQVLDSFRKECQELGRWQELAEVQDGLWARLRQRRPGTFRALGEPSPQVYAKVNWDIYRAPLVEAQLQLGRQEEADLVVQDWIRNNGACGSLEALCALAEKLQMPGLAAQWRKLPTR